MASRKKVLTATGWGKACNDKECDDNLDKKKMKQRMNQIQGPKQVLHLLENIYRKNK
jgi:hypothetical protein